MIEPVNSRRTSRASDGSSGAMSTVTIDRPVSASRVIRPWPISPLAPVTRTVDARIYVRMSSGCQAVTARLI